jgi:hypothetical protein
MRIRGTCRTLVVSMGLILVGAGPAGAAECLPGRGSGPEVCDDFFTPTQADTGIPSGFVALMCLGFLVGIAITIYKVSMARDMARKSGMDADQATAMTLLTDDGLEATYLASSLRGQPMASADPSAPTSERTPKERLDQLRELLADGTITQAEFDQRRSAILDSI